MVMLFFFFFQAEDGIRDKLVTGVQTCALPISCGEEFRHIQRSPRKTRRGEVNREATRPGCHPASRKEGTNEKHIQSSGTRPRAIRNRSPRWPRTLEQIQHGLSSSDPRWCVLGS